MPPKSSFGTCSSFRDREAVGGRAPVLALLIILTLSLAGFCQPTDLHAAGIETFYAPEDLPGDKLLELYTHARRYIYVAVYGLTYPPVVKALVSAKKRGVDVRVITDREKLSDPKQMTALETLRLAGIPIRVNQHDALMHLKQVVIDDEVNTTGSMNHTGSGNRYNDERLDVITDHANTMKARDKFLAMWEDQVRYQEWR